MVYNRLKENILSGELKPGDRLHIGSLAKELVTSEIPVREAIQVLENEKLVEVVPHSGAIVAPVSNDDLNEILQLRIYLEALATYFAAPHLDESDLQKLEKNLKKQAFAIELEELEDFSLLNVEFHQLIYEKNPNKRLNDIIFNLWDHSKRYRSVFKNNAEFTEGSYQEHRQIFNLLAQKDAESAQELMRKHKERSAHEIKSKWNIE
nr:GntR family transcriptional regulator [Paenibacillus hamazuiensis]